jgi:hypothetical protein
MVGGHVVVGGIKEVVRGIDSEKEGVLLVFVKVMVP